MRSTFSILFYINRNRIKADGTTAVMCRITIDGKNTVMTTGICCKPEDWNAKNGTVRTVRENNRLQEYRKYIEQCYEDILKTQRCCQCRNHQEPYYQTVHRSYTSATDGRN